jgi:hypothetical protein
MRSRRVRSNLRFVSGGVGTPLPAIQVTAAKIACYPIACSVYFASDAAATDDAAMRASHAREPHLDLASYADSSHRAGSRAARPLPRFASTAPEARGASGLA